MKHYLHTMLKSAIALSICSICLIGTDAMATDFTEGSNCYIISEAGTHSFEPKKVDGTAIAISKADWLWAEKNPADEAQSMISDVAYTDGKVTFTTTDREGNATIAGFDDSGKIVWIWHIWCTDEPKDVALNTGAIFQDRLLGAVGASQDGITNSHPESWTPIGFQWGRSIPFFNGYSTEDPNVGMSEPQQYTQINPSYSDAYSWNINATKSVSIEDSYAAPTTFFVDQSSCNWYLEEDSTLWAAKAKTNYDPCPAGYKVPTGADFADFAETAELVSNIGYTYTNSEGNTSWWRGCGSGRDFLDGINDATSGGGSTPIFYWLADQFQYDEFWQLFYGNGTWPKRMLMTCNPETSETNGFGPGNRSFSHVVRCVKIDQSSSISSVKTDSESGLAIRQSAGSITAYFAAGQFSALSIIDAAGRTIVSTPITSDATNLAIDTHAFSAGFYIVVAQSSTSTATQKVIIK